MYHTTRTVFRCSVYREYQLHDFTRRHRMTNRCYKWCGRTGLSETCHLIGSDGVSSMMVTVGVRSFLAPAGVRYPVYESRPRGSKYSWHT